MPADNDSSSDYITSSIQPEDHLFADAGSLPCQVFVRMECPRQMGLSLLTAFDTQQETHPNCTALCPSAHCVVTNVSRILLHVIKLKGRPASA